MPQLRLLYCLQPPIMNISVCDSYYTQLITAVCEICGGNKTNIQILLILNLNLKITSLISAKYHITDNTALHWHKTEN